MKKFVIAALGGTIAGTLLSVQVAPLLAEETSKPASVYQELDLFGDVFKRIRSDYVEQVDDKKLIEAAINGMLSSLDPHSSYMPADEYDDMKVQTRGSFGGLGIEVTMENGAVKVVSPMDGTPAAAAGIQSGDFITHVNGESLMGLTLDDAVDKMRGPVGSEVTLKIVREGKTEPFDVALTRDTIKLTAVKGRLEANTAVLRITTFNDQTFPNLQESLKKVADEAGGIDKLNGVVIDLRNNPGGLLTQAIAVSDAFLDKGEIVSTRGRKSEDSERFNATPGDLVNGKPIVVLINGGSASASEIVTGALQDHHRAIVVGTKSFGKGSVQTVIPVQNEGAMRLTTSRYYTPSGRSIQALGIAPDIVVPQPPEAPDADKATEDTPETRSEADLRGVLSNDSMTEDEKKQAEEERSKAEEAAKLRLEDFQLAYAIDIIKGLAVAGQTLVPVDDPRTAAKPAKP
ncbi:carboxyl-terminal processing protease [Rhodobacter viridis]|uniref:Carboxyl-terminal processing protease n=1 Tax=Rhodobacter viridis TaxID=1054202 RepID=A0A318UFN7_9RHOB|nr:S41 family peptidase [Rhodobacter viridis]PYF11867.1 carboxyl-terminal processing protease [Rhodobacter viridis]